MNNLKKEKRKEFEELWSRIQENKSTSIEGRMIWNVNDDDDTDDGWVYVDETIWNFIEKAISQSKEELIGEIKDIKNKKHFYFNAKYPDLNDGIISGYYLAIEDILEDLNKK